jgi:hypothetical protein
MRFLKTLTLNRRAIYDDRLAIDTASGVVMNTPNNLLIPKGGTADRPTSPVNGMIRYNTELNEIPGFPGTYYGEFEVYQGSSWRILRFQEPNAISLQTLGPGDDSTVTFGPLNPDPFTYTAKSGVSWDAAQIAKNLVVLVENVFQIGTVNFNIIQLLTGPGSTPETYIQFGTPVPTTKYVYILHKFDQ